MKNLIKQHFHFSAFSSGSLVLSFLSDRSKSGVGGSQFFSLSNCYDGKRKGPKCL